MFNVISRMYFVAALFFQAPCASLGYSYMLERFLSRLQSAGDPVRVCVLWTADMRHGLRFALEIRSLFVRTWA